MKDESFEMSGVVYAIEVSGLNEVAYVGASSRYGFRKKQHIESLRKHKHANSNLQSIFDSLGEEALSFRILEVAGPHEPLRIYEQTWIDRLRPVCNQYGAVDPDDMLYYEERLTNERPWYEEKYECESIDDYAESVRHG